MFWKFATKILIVIIGLLFSFPVQAKVTSVSTEEQLFNENYQSDESSSSEQYQNEGEPEKEEVHSSMSAHEDESKNSIEEPAEDTANLSQGKESIDEASQMDRLKESENISPQEDSGIAVVKTVAEIRTALKDSAIHTIQLADDLENKTLDIKAQGINITRDVTIDGNNSTIFYRGTGTSQGFYSSNGSSSQIEVRFKNINFGSPSDGTKAYNYYGIFKGTSDATKYALTFENVKYYSSASSQPIYSRNNNPIIFEGENYFQQGSGPDTHEWAEGNNFIFAENSRTVIDHQPGGNVTGFIWANLTLNFELKKNASVEILTNKSFIYTDGNAPVVKMGEGANLDITFKNGISNQRFIHQSRNFTTTVNKNGRISIKTLDNRSIDLHDGQNSFELILREGASANFESSKAGPNLFLDPLILTAYQPAAIEFLMPNGTGEMIGKDVLLQFPDNLNEDYQFTFPDQNETFQQKLNGNVRWQYVSGEYVSSRISSVQENFSIEEKNYFGRSKHMILEPATIPPVINALDATASEDQVTGRIIDFTNQQGNLEQSQYLLASEPLTSEELMSNELTSNKKVVSNQLFENSSEMQANFANLAEETDYWLYARLSNGHFPANWGPWFMKEVSTTRALMEISVPVDILFTTNQVNGQPDQIISDDYEIKNNSRFAVKSSLQKVEKKIGNIQLTNGISTTKKTLALRITSKTGSSPYLLEESTDQYEFDIDSKQDFTFGLAGYYSGPFNEREEVAYTFRFAFERKE